MHLLNNKYIYIALIKTISWQSISTKSIVRHMIVPLLRIFFFLIHHLTTPLQLHLLLVVPSLTRLCMIYSVEREKSTGNAYFIWCRRPYWKDCENYRSLWSGWPNTNLIIESEASEILKKTLTASTKINVSRIYTIFLTARFGPYEEFHLLKYNAV
jgi:hypothetical protein